MPKKPVLVGVQGHIDGEKVVLEYGKTVVVGRSRSADFSLRRIPEIAELSDDERQSDHDLRTVSGKHFEITPFSEDSIEIVNLSPNGTYVDGKRVDKVVIDDIAEKAHEIKLGAKEVLRLELRDADSDEAKAEGAGDGDADADKADAGGPDDKDAKADDKKPEGEKAEDAKAEDEKDKGAEAGDGKDAEEASAGDDDD